MLIYNPTSKLILSRTHPRNIDRIDINCIILRLFSLSVRLRHCEAVYVVLCKDRSIYVNNELSKSINTDDDVIMGTHDWQAVDERTVIIKTDN
jgi:hypothetical protein